MSEAVDQVAVNPNRPRLMEPGAAPPPPPQAAEEQLLPQEPQRYWTEDRVGYFYAQACRAAAMATDVPGLRASKDEIEMISPPAAAVLNDYAPITVGDQGSRTANLITLAIVLALLVVLKLPEIMLAIRQVRERDKPAKSEPKAETPASPSALPREEPQAAPPAPAASRRERIFEAQLI